jgi:hypothetical protein
MAETGGLSVIAKHALIKKLSRVAFIGGFVSSSVPSCNSCVSFEIATCDDEWSNPSPSDFCKKAPDQVPCAWAGQNMCSPEPNYTPAGPNRSGGNFLRKWRSSFTFDSAGLVGNWWVSSRQPCPFYRMY